MATNNDQPDCQVVYVGPSRRGLRISPLQGVEHQNAWRERQAAEMEEVCREMRQPGLHLAHVGTGTMSNSFAGGSTEGAWLYFGAA